ncbi:hypothetical protein BEP19_12565 [Ammoniphilus oxalaticus]|uniref:Zinc permease n=1 Tax=Ammoniphilus oxalaticus TaxID=66863 RepID=A0A419SGY3_9BACL|nr:ZIP family metal transporter [Ammoniphilus oxalaticus]RKD23052.1 hypothetical protein BEP19_12565 [Ammoniphilus oxalaticus]
MAMELLTLSLSVGFMTTFGVMLGLNYGQPSRRALAFYLGLATGIMSLIIVMDLLPAAFGQGPIEAVGIGLGCGLLMMLILYEGLHRRLHNRPVNVFDQESNYLRMGLSICVAMIVHHIPEGIAIGAGYETHHQLGVIIALSIALHNIPEGIGMAIPLRMAGMRRRTILLVSLIISSCIPFGAYLGKYLFVQSVFMVSFGMAFAAGSMGFIVWKELAPVSLKHHRLFALLGMAFSLVLIFLIQILR